MSYIIFSLSTQIFLGLCGSINKNNFAGKVKDTVAGEEQIKNCKWTLRQMVFKKGFHMRKILTRNIKSTGKFTGCSVYTKMLI
jgi:hypothetical protein